MNDSSSVFSGMEPIAVHRLDLETSGLLLLAKDKRTATELQSQFEGRRVRKTYLAVCAVLEDAPAAQKAAETRAKIREEEEEAGKITPTRTRTRRSTARSSACSMRPTSKTTST